MTAEQINTGAVETMQAQYSRLLVSQRNLAALERLGTVRSVPKGYVLARAGQVPESCYIVRSGRVMGYEYTASGEERVYNFNEAGSLLLDANTLLRQTLPVSFMTLVPSTLVCIPRETLVAALNADPSIAIDLLYSVSYKFLASMEQVRELSCHNVPWKICNLLLVFAERFGVSYDNKILIKEKISQQMIASLLGINRVTVVRTVKELRELNLIEQVNGFYCIRSVSGLRRHMDTIDRQ